MPKDKRNQTPAKPPRAKPKKPALAKKPAPANMEDDEGYGYGSPVDDPLAVGWAHMLESRGWK